MADAISNVTSSNNLSGSFTSSVSQSSSKDDFLKLLTYQLRAQNPMKPYDNQEFASQLAQFSQLEQLTSIKSLIESQIKSNQTLTQTMSNIAIPGMLGKNAKASANSFNFDGENNVPIGYSLNGSAISGEINIRNSSGSIVRTISLTGGDLKSGDHKLNWDGKNNNGEILTEGTYSMEVVAKRDAKSSYSADTFIFGAVQAVKFKSEGTMIVINGNEIPLENIINLELN